MADFDDNSVAKNLNLDEFASLDKATKRKLIGLMARISEQSYRRGFQHGKLPKETVDPDIFRNSSNKNRSPNTDTIVDGQWKSSSGMSLTERLHTQYGVLHQIGFPEEI